MSILKGMGSCAIPTEGGMPCGRQISEGEPIGTVAITVGSPPRQNPVVGHKKCAEAFTMRERDKMKLGKQSGPGGAVDSESYGDALAHGSVPLERSPGGRDPDDDLYATSEAPKLLSDLPEGADPWGGGDAVSPEVLENVERSVPTDPERNIYRDGTGFRDRLEGGVKPSSGVGGQGQYVAQLVGILTDHQVAFNGALLGDLIDWKFA